MRGLIDSLVARAPCALTTLPPVRTLPENISSAEACALVAASLRRLAHEPANPPYWEPGDTALIDSIGIYMTAFAVVDTTGASLRDSLDVSVLRWDTTLSVELDVSSRPRLIRVMYAASSHEETFGVVHR